MSNPPPSVPIVPRNLEAQSARELASWQLAIERHERATLEYNASKAHLEKCERSMRECARAVQLTATIARPPAPAVSAITPAAPASTPPASTMGVAGLGVVDGAAGEVLHVMATGESA